MSVTLASLQTRLRMHWPVALGVAYLLSGVYVVRPAEQAVVRLFGKVVDAHVEPGLRYRLPYPVTRLDKVRVRERKRLTIGFQLADQPLGRQPSAAETQFLTGDYNLVNIQAVVQYSIREAEHYLFAAREIEALVGGAVDSALTEVMTGTPVDDILTVGKVGVQNDTRKRAQEILDGYGAGVLIVQVTIQKPYPPEEVLAAFNDVASAREDRDRIRNEALGYANDLVPRARGEGQRLLQQADAYRTTKINRAAGEAQRFRDLLVEYDKAQDVTSARLYVEAMEQILPKMKKVFVDAPNGRSPVDLTLIKPAEPTPKAETGAAGERPLK
ncbi:MAG: FtsH protease activity modulator HflK [Armatimonadetes bacterium CG_4_10_14_3_um_filter_66_18]|nr:FtsH protease activity modulator HflK [Armatimonadota bacterium]PIU90477.1 MAG: FtsH protease activity modulator HflK [Armatimonadetes bacterium CG06_land_8_20_14_3_00_66_21]PIX42530.1 MAG: FtsH protease activity modulator HflK [Armatimonadetes bacterium CG_4_8_14_3_um_filter_66_20]PIY38016.1 MAG: FtsH protease activity modulator HflK [Armatimonadetes bacterium CG_4_10_14_3_um_filter_66_18]PIZ45510.1 MAG: FtsH protease activity modulator HflK [Armatimonadetes bacterium CG_4_10_14_0_8_um_filt